MNDQQIVPQDFAEEYLMHHVSAGPTRPYHVYVKLNGSPVRMEIDTGVSVSVVGEGIFKAIQRGEQPLELQKTSIRLRTYTGGEIPVRGSVRVPVEHNGQNQTLPLIVTEGEGPSLIGRDWLATLRLDWQVILTVEQNLSLKQVLDKHSSVFKEGLSKLRDVEAKIYIAQNERPRFRKPYQVSFALRQKVEEELERLQALGVIQPVQFSDWAAPIVPIMKSDGRVRICGDYKITVNQAAKLEKYIPSTPH